MIRGALVALALALLAAPAAAVSHTWVEPDAHLIEGGATLEARYHLAGDWRTHPAPVTGAWEWGGGGSNLFRGDIDHPAECVGLILRVRGLEHGPGGAIQVSSPWHKVCSGCPASASSDRLEACPTYVPEPPAVALMLAGGLVVGALASRPRSCASG